MIEQITTSYVGSSDSESESDPFAAGGGGGVTGGEDPFADLRGKMMGLDESESIVGAFNSPAARPSWSSDRDQTRLWHESNYYKHRGRIGGSCFK